MQNANCVIHLIEIDSVDSVMHLWYYQVSQTSSISKREL